MSKLKFSFLILVAAELIYNISSYVINIGLGRMLGVADYGRYSLVIGFTTMVILLVGRGIPTAMAKRMSENLDNWSVIRAIRTSAAHMQLIIILTLTVVFFLSAPLIANVFNDPTLTPLFRISALIIPAFALSSFHVLYFNGLKFFKAMTAMKIARGLFRMLWILGLAYTLQLEGAFYGAIAAPLSVFCIAMIIEHFFLKEKKEQVEKDIAPYPWQKILSYAGGFMLFLVFYEFYIRADMYLIKALTGSDINTGLYNAAFTIALIPYYAMFALTFLLFPTISDLAEKKDYAEIQKMLSKVTIFLLATLIPVACTMALIPELLVSLFFGIDFMAAANLIPLMFGGTVFATIFFVFASVFNGANMTRVSASITFIGLIIGITANIIYLPVYGIIATATIFSVTSTFMGLSAMIVAHLTLYKNKNTLF